MKLKGQNSLNLLNNFSSDCNSTYELIQFSNTNYTDKRNYLYGFYYIYYNFGVIPQQIIYTIRKFASIFITAAREKDTQGRRGKGYTSRCANTCRNQRRPESSGERRQFQGRFVPQAQ